MSFSSLKMQSKETSIKITSSVSEQQTPGKAEKQISFLSLSCQRKPALKPAAWRKTAAVCLFFSPIPTDRLPDRFLTSSALTLSFPLTGSLILFNFICFNPFIPTDRFPGAFSLEVCFNPFISTDRFPEAFSLQVCFTPTDRFPDCFFAWSLL